MAAPESGTGAGAVILDGTTGVIRAKFLDGAGAAAFKLQGAVVMSTIAPLASGRIEGTLTPVAGGDAIAFEGRIAAQPGGNPGAIEGFDMAGVKIFTGKLKLGALDLRTQTVRGSLQLQWRM